MLCVAMAVAGCISRILLLLLSLVKIKRRFYALRLYFVWCARFFAGRARRAGQCLLFYAKMRNVKKTNYLSYTGFFLSLFPLSSLFIRFVVRSQTHILPRNYF